jgi:hypothetical protein
VPDDVELPENAGVPESVPPVSEFGLDRASQRAADQAAEGLDQAGDAGQAGAEADGSAETEGEAEADDSTGTEAEAEAQADTEGSSDSEGGAQGEAEASAEGGTSQAGSVNKALESVQQAMNDALGKVVGRLSGLFG